MADPLKYLLHGFDSAYKQGVSEFNQEQHSKNILEREQQNELFKEQQKQKLAAAKKKEDADAGIRYRNGTPQEKEDISINYPHVVSGIKANVDLQKDEIEQQKKAEADKAESQSNEFINSLEGRAPTPDQYGKITTKGWQRLKDEKQYEKEAKPKPEILSLGHGEIDTKNNTITHLKGHLIPEGEEDKYPDKTKVHGQWYAVTNRSTTARHLKKLPDGSKDWTNATKILYDNYHKGSRNLHEALDTGMYKNEPITPQVRTKLEKEVKNYDDGYVKAIKNSMPTIAKKWYQDLYNIKKPDSSGKMVNANPSPDQFMREFVKDYKNGYFGTDKNNKYPATRSIAELYRATYGKEPYSQEPDNTEEPDTEDTSNDENE